MKNDYCIVYVSSAVKTFTLEQAQSVSDIRKEYCRAQHVSGLLIYGGGNFLRMIIGQSENVKLVFKTEQLEAPQFDVIKLYEGPIQTNYFEDYPMAVHILQNKELKPLDEFSSPEMKEYLEECLSTEEPAMNVIREFIKNNV